MTTTMETILPGNTIRTIPGAMKTEVTIEVQRVRPVDGGFVVTGQRVTADGKTGIGTTKAFYVNKAFEVLS